MKTNTPKPNQQVCPERGQASRGIFPVLRFKEFTDEWQEKKLGDFNIKVIDGDRGKNYPNGNDFSDNGYCLFLNAKNVTSSGFSFSERSFINEQKDSELRKGKLKENDLVLTTRGTIGNIAFFDQNILYKNMRINSGMVILRSDGAEISPSYLYLFSKSTKLSDQIKKISFGSAQPQLTVKDILRLKLTVPLLTEQSKIALFLISVDEKINHLEEKKRGFEKYKKGVMQAIFSQKIRFKKTDGSNYPDWEEKKLGEIGEFFRGHSYTAINVKEDDYLVLRSNNIQNNKLLTNQELQFVDKPFGDQIKLRKNDIAICMANGSKKLVGKSAVYDGSYNGHATVGAFCSIYRSTNLISKYLFRMPKYEQEIELLLSGTNINNLKNSDLAGIVFNLPKSIDEQEKIAVFLTALDSKVDLINKELEQAKLFKKALLQQMFI